MRGRPRFKAGFRVDVVSPDLVFLSHETDYEVLEGRLYALLAPLLNGRNTAADIADKLEGRITVLDVDYGLAELRRRGYLAAGEQPPLRDAGLDSSSRRRLQRARVSLTPIGTLAESPVAAQLRNAGVRPARSRLDLVVVNEYLCEELQGVNRRAFRRRRPWMLVKPVGAIPWVGPIVNPPHTGCWECLAQRLRDHRPVEALLEARGLQKRRTDSSSMAALSPDTRRALRRAAAEALKWAARGGSALEAGFLAFDGATEKFETHAFIRWESCPVCGGRKRRPRSLPLALRSRKRIRTDESGSRSARLAETFARLQRHVSPVAGIVHELRPYYSDKSGLAHVYLARHAYPPGPAILSA
ncbi:MAG TPA: TOMM precursor leader peptide-binding protein, partial [Candidatus Acidoferrales bacterium]